MNFRVGFWRFGEVRRDVGGVFGCVFTKVTTVSIMTYDRSTLRADPSSSISNGRLLKATAGTLMSLGNMCQTVCATKISGDSGARRYFNVATCGLITSIVNRSYVVGKRNDN